MGRLATFGVLTTAIICALLLGTGIAAAHPGDLDRSFGTEGRLTVPTPSGFQPELVKLFPDGRIVMVDRGVGNVGVVLLRYTAAGALDPSFGDGGVARPAFPATFQLTDLGVGPGSIAETPDGGLLIAGSSYDAGGSDSAIAKLRSDGTTDSTFGDRGVTKVSFPGRPRFFSVALQGDGKIVATGGTTDGYSGVDALLARLTPNGSLDESFMGSGQTTPADMEFPVVAVDGNGRVVVVGGELGCARLGSDCNFPRVIRGLTFGFGPVTPDPGELLFTPESGWRADVRGVAILPDGRTLLLGAQHRAGTRDYTLLSLILDDRLRLREWRAIRDRRFAMAGLAGIDPRSRAVVVTRTGPSHIAIGRLAESGLALDRSFGRRGQISVEVGRLAAYAQVAVQPDGNVLVLAGPLSRATLQVRPPTLFRYLGGDDRVRPIVTVVPRSGCRAGRRSVEVRVRDESTLARVFVRRGGRPLADTAQPRMRLRVWARTADVVKRTLRIDATDAAGNSVSVERTLRRCP